MEAIIHLGLEIIFSDSKINSLAEFTSYLDDGFL